MTNPRRNPAATALGRLVRCWPATRPMVVLSWSGDPQRPWSFVGEPRETLRASWGADHGDPFRIEQIDLDSGHATTLDARDPLDALESIIAAAPPHGEAGAFRGGWIGFTSYDFGRRLEPTAAHPQRSGPGPSPWPALEFHHCPAGFLIDHRSGRVTWHGQDVARPELVDTRPRGFVAGEISGRSADDAAAYQHAVTTIIEHIRAGDIFQANLAHRLLMPFEGSTRTAFLTLLRRARPWHGAYLELAPRQGVRSALCSLSPELFLEVGRDADDGDLRITTRPMKGTRPAPPQGDPAELLRSEKDRAELTMIVDLMRNDLGRVCIPGSIRAGPRIIEHHGGARGVLQATAAVTGVLPESAGPARVLRATFPPGSVTGAPKVRAMQIIDQLEPALRGPYCGIIGWIADRTRYSFNVAIRTALISGAAPKEADAPNDVIEGGTLLYSVGAGIVADSVPGAEWEETLTKARALGALRSTLHPAAR